MNTNIGGMDKTAPARGGPAGDGIRSDADARSRADEFRRVFHGQDGEGGKAAGDDGKRAPDPAPSGEMPPAFSGDALLRGLGLAPAPEVAEGAPLDAPRLAEELVERILVKTNAGDGNGEVRISLKDSVLPDTEIILLRDENRLVICLASANAASLERLEAARRDLKDRLDAQGIAATVELRDEREPSPGSGRRDSGASGGERSRGLDYLPES